MKGSHLLGVGSWLAAFGCLLDCGSSDAPTVVFSLDASGAAGAPTTVGGTTLTGTTVSGTTSTTTSETTTTGPTTTTATGSTGAGGDMTTGTSAGSTVSTTVSGSGGSGNGGSGQAGAGGAGPVDGGMCPPMQPFNGTTCASLGAVCNYPASACTCGPAGMTRDGGSRNGWTCTSVRPDGGGGAIDAGGCPVMAPANGSMCVATGEVCAYARETCTCQMPMGRGMRDRWVCTPAGRDGGGRGG